MQTTPEYTYLMLYPFGAEHLPAHHHLVKTRGGDRAAYRARNGSSRAWTRNRIETRLRQVVLPMGCKLSLQKRV
jgi:hypothetical protein